MRKKRRDAPRACLHVSLPGGSVPKGILAGKLAIERVELSLALPGGRKRRIRVKGSPQVRLYVLNRPLEEIHAQHADMVRELLDLRSRLMLMAMRLGLKGRVPSSRNGLTWLQLADLIRARLARLNSFYLQSRVSATVGERISDEDLASLRSHKFHKERN